MNCYKVDTSGKYILMETNNNIVCTVGKVFYIREGIYFCCNSEYQYSDSTNCSSFTIYHKKNGTYTRAEYTSAVEYLKGYNIDLNNIGEYLEYWNYQSQLSTSVEEMKENIATVMSK